MPNSDPFIKDIEAQMARIHETNAKIKDDITRIIDIKGSGLKAASMKLELKTLLTRIDMLKNDIETIIYLQRSQGKEPDVTNLQQQLDTMLADYESLKAKYQLEFPKPKPWWKFWK